jgi:hypothetical protein
VPPAPATRPAGRTSNTASVSPQAGDLASQAGVTADIFAGQLPIPVWEPHRHIRPGGIRFSAQRFAEGEDVHAGRDLAGVVALESSSAPRATTGTRSRTPGRHAGRRHQPLRHRRAGSLPAAARWPGCTPAHCGRRSATWRRPPNG